MLWGGGLPGILLGYMYKRDGLLVICGHVQGVARDAIVPQSCASTIVSMGAQLCGS